MKAVDYRSLGFAEQHMYDFPNIVNVEVYRGECPCRCVHCPVGQTDPSERAARFGDAAMSLELYRQIVEEVGAYPHSSLRIHSVGEPLLWAGLSEAARLTREKQVKSWIFTSAVTKDTGILEMLCESMDIIEVSVNSTSREDYAATKGIDSFELVERNIAHMHAHAEKMGLPTILIASRVQTLDRAADDEFVRHWKSTGLVTDAFVRSYHTYNELMPELDSGDAERRHQPCLVHWARFSIGVDGRAVVCFNELFKERLDPSLVLGDVSRRRIADIWQGPELSALRRAELSGDYSRLPFGDALPCKDCISCQPLRGTAETSEHQLGRLARKAERRA